MGKTSGDAPVQAGGTRGSRPRPDAQTPERACWEFDRSAARLEIERGSRSFQRGAAIISALTGSLFPLAFLAHDLIRHRKPLYVNYLVPFAVLVVLAALYSLQRFNWFTKATIVASLVLGFALSVTLPYSRTVYIVIFFCFAPITFLILGARRGLAVSALFLLFASILGFLMLKGTLRGSIESMSAATYAMAIVAFAFQCIISTVIESRHARSIDNLVERRFYDDETRLPNTSALAMESIAAGEALLLVHVANLRDLGILASQGGNERLASRVAQLLLDWKGAHADHHGPFKVSETDFCFIMPPHAPPAGAADSIYAVFCGTAAIPGTPLHFTTRIVSYRADAAQRTDVAMDKVLAALSDCIASDAASLHRGGRAESEDRTNMMSHAPVLLRNIEHALFKPVFQPVYDLERDGIGFLEALIRLDEDGAAVSPERYLDTVFRLGLDRFLSEFILAEALDMALRSGHTVSFNATFRDIMLPSFRKNLDDAFRALEGRPNTLIVEITEQAAVDDPSALMEFVGGVHARGGLVFLDDFGSGYSNYASLLASRFDAVKAAGEIVREITVRPEAYTLYRGMTAFCAEAGLSVVAEHISDESIQKAAMAGGARYLQGYLFSPPVGAQAVLRNEFKFPAGFSSARTPLESPKALRA